ncbi:hypothetical protein LG200_05585 [Methylobacillus caricis]|uniref:hypothetical protein n=1 Tax=Methylobacillus caricis TaxID=1971611 RepID=UPI001CFFBE4A|nr:hypothetical protein [Methylobacillus caricis]MCB5187477.1 hypothetical protein [Methylobacillus caricis]
MQIDPERHLCRCRFLWARYQAEDKSSTVASNPGEASFAVASIAVAETLTTEIALLASNKMLELSGTSSTLE